MDFHLCNEELWSYEICSYAERTDLPILQYSLNISGISEEIFSAYSLIEDIQIFVEPSTHMAALHKDVLEIE